MKSAAVMQASLALVATLAGVAVAISEGSGLWFVGACLIFVVVPFTFLGIMPTNKQLLDPERDRTSEETKVLLEKWGRLHAVRSVSSFAASILYVYLGVAT